MGNLYEKLINNTYSDFEINALFNSQRRQEFVERILDDTERKIQEFFLFFDRNTNRNLIGIYRERAEDEITDDELMDAITVTGTSLLFRVMKRGRLARENQIPNENDFQGCNFMISNSNLDNLSKYQIKIFEKYFLLHDLFDVSLFSNAFELFSNGELRISGDLPNCEPDGAHYFLFAEFAIACIEKQIDENFWKTILKPYVMTQEYFMSAYKPEILRFNNYNVYEFSEHKQLSDQKKQELRNFYLPMGHEDLIKQMGINVLNAFNDEI